MLQDEKTDENKSFRLHSSFGTKFDKCPHSLHLYTLEPTSMTRTIKDAWLIDLHLAISI